MKNILLSFFVFAMIPSLSSQIIDLDRGLLLYAPFKDGTAVNQSPNFLPGTHGMLEGAHLGEDPWGDREGGVYFDGVDDFGHFGALPLLETGSVSFWVSSFSRNGGCIMSGQGDAYRLEFMKEGNVRLTLQLPEGQTYPFISPQALNDGKFHHLAFTFDGEWCRFYIDGKEVDGKSYLGAGLPLEPNGNELWLARDADGQFLHAAMDELLIYNRALSSEEIGLLFAGVFVEADLDHQSHCVQYLPLNGNGINQSVNRVVGSDARVIGATPAKGRGETDLSLHFDGKDDYLDLGTWMDTTEFSLSLWFQTYSSNPGTLFSWPAYGLSGYLNLPGHESELVITCSGNLDTLVLGQSGLASGDWHHLVLRYDGRQLKCYLNTKAQGEINCSFVGQGAATSSLLLGKGSESVFYNGQLQDVRIYNKAIQPEIINALASGNPLQPHWVHQYTTRSTDYPVLTAGSASLPIEITLLDIRSKKLHTHTSSGQQAFLLELHPELVRGKEVEVIVVQEGNISRSFQLLTSAARTGP